MSTSKELIKPDASKPLVKRANWLTVSDDMQLVTIDNVEEIDNPDGTIDKETGKIKKIVEVSCRTVIIKRDEEHFDYSADKEPLKKQSVSTSSWYLLSDFRKATHWPKEGIFYWVWKGSDKDGIRWEQAED